MRLRSSASDPIRQTGHHRVADLGEVRGVAADQTAHCDDALHGADHVTNNAFQRADAVSDPVDKAVDDRRADAERPLVAQDGGAGEMSPVIQFNIVFM